MAGWANSGNVMYSPDEMYGVNYGKKFDTPMIEQAGINKSSFFNSNNPVSLLENQYNKELSDMPEGGYLGNISLPEMPRLNLSEYRPSRVRNIRQQVASPYLSKAGSAISRAIATANAMGNSPAAQQAVREAIAGYGEGMGSIMAGAGREARGQYGEELGLENQGIMSQYNVDVNRNNLNAQLAIRNAEAKEAYRQKLMDRLVQISLLKQQILTNRENQDIASQRGGSSIGSFANVANAERERQDRYMLEHTSGSPKANYGTPTPTPTPVSAGNEWDNIYREFTGTWNANTGGTSPSPSPITGQNDAYAEDARRAKEYDDWQASQTPTSYSTGGSIVPTRSLLPMVEQPSGLLNLQRDMVLDRVPKGLTYSYGGA